MLNRRGGEGRHIRKRRQAFMGLSSAPAWTRDPIGAKPYAPVDWRAVIGCVGYARPYTAAFPRCFKGCTIKIRREG